MATTIFRGYWHKNLSTGGGQDNAWKNYTDPVTIPIVSGSVIPTQNVIIKNVTYTLYTTIYTSRELFLTNIAPKVSSNNNQVQDGGLLLSKQSSFYLTVGNNQYYNIEGAIIPNFYCGKNNLQVVLAVARRTDNNSGYVSSDNYHYVEAIIEWEQTTPCSPPQNIELSKYSVGPESEVTLSWSNAKAGNNTGISGYWVYQSSTIENEGELYGGFIETSLTYGSIKVYAPSAKGETYYYRIQTCSPDGSNFDSELSAIIALKADYTDVSINYLTINGKKENIYIGESGAQNVSMVCFATDGTNNAIKTYTFSEDEVEKQSSSSNVLIGTFYGGREYSVKIEGTYSNSNSTLQERSITTKTLNFESWKGLESLQTRQNNYTIPISVSPPIPTEAAALLSNEIRYNIYYYINNETYTLNTNLTTIPTSITLPSEIAKGAIFQIGITATGTAADGGTTSVTQKSGNLRIANSPNPATILSVKDQLDSSSGGSGIKAYAYGIIDIAFSAATKNEGSGEEFVYSLVTVIDDGTEKITSINNGNNSLIATYDMGILQEGAKVAIKIRTTDNYGSVVDSPQIIIYKFAHPSITLNPPSVAKGKGEEGSLYCSISGSFNTTIPALAAGSKINYKIEVLHNESISKIVYSNSFKTSSLQTYGPLNIFCPEEQPSSNDSFNYNLYNTIILQQNPRPVGQLKITTYYDNFEQYPQSKIINFTYDFYEKLQEDFGTFIVNYPSGRKDNYINPLENFTISYTLNDWLDASQTGSLGGTLNLYIEGTGFTINKVEDSSQFNLQFNEYSDADKIINLLATYELTFKGNPSIVDRKTKIIEVKLARWWKDKEQLYLKTSEFKQLENGNRQISGSINLPELKCSSKNYFNLFKIQCQLKNKDKDINNENIDDIIEIEIAKKEDLEITEIPFIIEVEENEFNLNAAVTFINNAGNEIILETPSVHMLDSEVTLAIRKSKIGINTSMDYIPRESDPTLLINASQNTNSSIVKVVSLKESSKETPIDFLTLSCGTEQESIFRMTPNGLEITNLLLDSENATGNFLTINVDNIIEGEANLINADTLGGIKASQYALKTDLNNYENLTFDNISGILSVNKGGTGASTFASGKVLIGNGTNTFLTRDITNITTIEQNIKASENLITENTLYYYNGTSNISKVGTITEGTWNGSVINSSYIGALSQEHIPNLSASKITSGTLSTSVFPSLDASIITTGIFNASQIPNLDAKKITSGTFSVNQIPNLSASMITSGTLSSARLPFKINYGVTTAYTDDGTWISFSTSFSNTNYSIVATYAKTNDVISGSWGPLKIYNKTTSGCYITIGGSASPDTLRDVNWIAIGT